MPSPEPKKRRCARPFCFVEVKPGQLACREHWFGLSSELRDRLVFAWEQRKAHPDVPELVDIHRALLLNALQQWGFTPEQIKHFIKAAPRRLPNVCPWCGEVAPGHRADCNRPGQGEYLS